MSKYIRRTEMIPLRKIPYSAAPSAEAVRYGMSASGGGKLRDPRAELNKMKRSLTQWLKFRDMNTAAGLTPAEQVERTQIETTLTAKIQALLLEVYGPDIRLPADAPTLARMVIFGQVPAATNPQATGILPFLIVAGAVALILMSAISSYADYAKEKEKYECIEKYGAWQCDTSGQLWKWGVVAGVAWLAWSQLGLGGLVKKYTGKGEK